MIIGTELFYIADGRMNTVFKFYMVAWTLLACCVPYFLQRVVETYKKVFVIKKLDAAFVSGGVLVLLVAELVFMFIDVRAGSSLFKAFFLATAVMSPAVFFFLKDRIGKNILAAGMLFIMLPAALYPVLGAIAKGGICSLNPPKPLTIDGTAYMKQLLPRPGTTTDFDMYDYQAIEWINTNIGRLDTILEAPGERMYTGVSRVSIFTGMPSYIGWGYQVSQQSGRDDVPGRTTAANYFYNNTAAPDQLLSLLHTNGIKYIYAGGIERATYPNMTRFDTVCDQVYSNPGVIIYKVR
jgi:uncharacterized membrane protein